MRLYAATPSTNSVVGVLPSNTLRFPKDNQAFLHFILFVITFPLKRSPLRLFCSLLLATWRILVLPLASNHVFEEIHVYATLPLKALEVLRMLVASFVAQSLLVSALQFESLVDQFFQLL